MPTLKLRKVGWMHPFVGYPSYTASNVTLLCGGLNPPILAGQNVQIGEMQS